MPSRKRSSGRFLPSLEEMARNCRRVLILDPTGVFRGGVAALHLVDLGVDFRAEQQHRCRDEEIEKQNHDSAKAAIERVVVGEPGDVELKADRRQHPC